MAVNIYLNSLINDRSTMVNNLQNIGVSVDNHATFTNISMVLENIPTGSNGLYKVNTVADMENISSPNTGDICLVSSIVGGTIKERDTVSEIEFPKRLTLPQSVVEAGFVDGYLKIGTYRVSVNLSANSLSLNSMGSPRLSIRYTSTDGVNFTTTSSDTKLVKSGTISFQSYVSLDVFKSLMGVLLTTEVNNFSGIFFYGNNAWTNYDINLRIDSDSLFEGNRAYTSDGIVNGTFSFSGRNAAVYAENILQNVATAPYNDWSYMFDRRTDLVNCYTTRYANSEAIENISYIFNGASNLVDSGMNDWNTINIKDMSGAFAMTGNNLSLDVSNWDTSNVTNACNMFYNLKGAVNGFTNWDTTNLVDMSYMFYGPYNTSNISNFDISNWNLENVENMSYAFSVLRNIYLDINLSNKNTYKLTDMSNAFYASNTYNTINLTNLNTTNVTNMRGILSYTHANIIGAGTLDTSNVVDLSHAFMQTSAPIAGIGNWNTINVTDMSWIFAHSFGSWSTNEVASWDTSNVTNMDYLMYSSNVEFNITPWDTSNVVSMNYMFSSINSGISSSYLNNVLTNLSTENAEYMSGLLAWSNASNSRFTGLNVSNLVSGNTKKINAFFVNQSKLSSFEGLDTWNTSSVINAEQVFMNCYNLTNIEALGSWNTSSLSNISWIFSGCNNLHNFAPISNWDTSNLVGIQNAFHNTGILNTDFMSNWDLSKVTSIYGLFTDTKNLTTVNFAGANFSSLTVVGSWLNNSTVTDVDMSGVNLHNITGLTFAFYNCSRLVNLKLEWGTLNTLPGTSPLYGCNALNAYSFLPDFCEGMLNITNIIPAANRVLNNTTGGSPIHGTMLQVNTATVGQEMIDRLTAAGWTF